MSITYLDEALTTPGEATREFYREQGRQQAETRIIKLLEAHPLITNDELGITYCGKEDCEGDLSFDYHASLTQHYIALIKGENK